MKLQKMGKKITRISSIILFLLLVSCFLFSADSVKAVGILGSNDFVIFEPGLKKTYTFVVVSNTDRVMDHSVGVGGDLAQYASTDKSVLEDLAPGELGSFSVNLTLPQELEAGIHELSVCALELETRGSNAGGTTIGTRAGVCLMIKVLSLYPEKIVEFDFFAPDVALGERAEFRLDVRSLSQQNISIKGDVDVYTNSSGSLVKLVSLATDEKLLESGKDEKLTTSLDTINMDIGSYIALATLHFDENSSTKNRTFKIGNLSMYILNHTQEVYADKVNNIDLFVQSKWNSDIKNVYAEMLITIDNKSIKLSSPTESFKPWEIKPIKIFWDAKNVSAGEYGTKTTLYYEGRTAEMTGKIKVTKKFEIPKSTLFLVIAIIVLLIVFILIVTRTMKKMRELEKRIKKSGR